MKHIIVLLALCALIAGCTTTKYVPIEHHTIDTLRITKYQCDSIYVHDSTFVKVDGDTVLIERWHTRWRDRWQHDTLYKSKTDSIPYPVEVVKEVPAELTWWQQARIHLANILLYLLLIAGIIWIGKKHIKQLMGE